MRVLHTCSGQYLCPIDDRLRHAVNMYMAKVFDDKEDIDPGHAQEKPPTHSANSFMTDVKGQPCQATDASTEKPAAAEAAATPPKMIAKSTATTEAAPAIREAVDGAKASDNGMRMSFQIQNKHQGRRHGGKSAEGRKPRKTTPTSSTWATEDGGLSRHHGGMELTFGPTNSASRRSTTSTVRTRQCQRSSASILSCQLLHHTTLLLGWSTWVYVILMFIRGCQGADISADGPQRWDLLLDFLLSTVTVWTWLS